MHKPVRGWNAHRTDRHIIFSKMNTIFFYFRFHSDDDADDDDERTRCVLSQTGNKSRLTIASRFSFFFFLRNDWSKKFFFTHSQIIKFYFHSVRFFAHAFELCFEFIATSFTFVIQAWVRFLLQSLVSHFKLVLFCLSVLHSNRILLRTLRGVSLSLFIFVFFFLKTVSFGEPRSDSFISLRKKIS